MTVERHPLEKEAKRDIFVYLGLIAFTLIVWSPSLQGHFMGDDSWHLPILYRFFQGHPEAIFNLFHAPFAYHESLYVFYRPLSDWTWLVDYFFWKANPFGYHLGNVLMHALCTCLVFLLCRQVLSYLMDRRLDIDWKIPLLVSLSFACYPCQAEPVCWVVCRVDLTAAALQFASLYWGLWSFNSRRSIGLYASAAFFLLGLLTKEMCATTPFILLFLFSVKECGFLDEIEIGSRAMRFLGALGRGLKRLWPMFLILAVFLSVRALVLDSVVGGYVGAAGQSLNISWMERLFSINHYWKLLHPLNIEIFGQTSNVDLCLRGIYLAIALLVVANYLRTDCMKTRIKLVSVLLVWLAIMFLPVVQIWNVSPGLIGTRLTYSFGFLIFFIFALLLYPISRESKHLRLASYLVFASLVLVFTYISFHHIGAWNQATKEIEGIRKNINNLLSEINPDSKLVLVNLPERISGIGGFYTMEFLPGFLAPPLSPVDVRKRVISLDGNPLNLRLFNLSRLQHLMADGNSYDYFFCDSKTHEFHRIAFPSRNELPASSERQLTVKPLGPFADYEWDPKTNGPAFNNRKPGGEIFSYSFLLEPGIRPLDYDFIDIDIVAKARDTGWESAKQDFVSRLPWVDNGQPKRIETAIGNSGMLSFDGQVQSTHDDGRPILFSVFDGAGTYRLDLTEAKSWLLSGPITEIRLDLPGRENRYNVAGAVLRRRAIAVPDLKFKGSSPMNAAGLIEADAADISFDFDCSRVLGATGAIVEVSRPYCEFAYITHTYRDSQRCYDALHAMVVKTACGSFQVPARIFAKPANYQIRVCATDADGSLAGTFSDPVSVAVSIKGKSENLLEEVRR